jgi:type II secretory pathway component GspD/PulD (secretin)
MAIGCGLCACPTSGGGWVIAEPRAGGAGYGASVTRSIPLHYLRASDALDLLPNFLLDYVHADAEVNAIVAVAPAWMLDRIAEDLAKLDAPPSEITLEVVAVEYTSRQALARDLRLERYLGDFAAGLDSLIGDLQFLWLESLPRGWDLLLDDLEVEASTQLRSRATVRVLNGHQASISAGQERTMVLESLQGPWLVANLEQIGTLHMLNVQPLVGRGDEVMLSLAIVVRSLAGTDPKTGLPILSLRRANGATRVCDGETIVLAGLRTAQQARQDRTSPLLGRLPLIGQLFRAPDRSRSETRLAFFITPHIMRPSPSGKGEADHA